MQHGIRAYLSRCPPCVHLISCKLRTCSLPIEITTYYGAASGWAVIHRVNTREIAYIFRDDFEMNVIYMGYQLKFFRTSGVYSYRIMCTDLYWINYTIVKWKDQEGKFAALTCFDLPDLLELAKIKHPDLPTTPPDGWNAALTNVINQLQTCR